MLTRAHYPRPHPACSRKCQHPHTTALRVFTLFAALLCADSALAETYRLPLFVDETPSGQTGVLRIDNESDASGILFIYAINDSGSRSGPATLTLAPAAAVEFDAEDLESGDTASGLSGGIGTLSGDVRLEIFTDLSINALTYLRTSDGTLAVLHDEVHARPTTSGGYEYRVPVFNAATNLAQASSLRLINPSTNTAMVSISGRDDSGAAAVDGSISLMLAPGGARTLTAQHIEAGGTGLTGGLGAGAGKWRLVVSADQPIEVVNLVNSSTGRVDNLSSAGRVGLAPVDHGVFSERFTGETISTRSENQNTELRLQAADQFSETVESGGADSSTRSGSYGYRRASTDAGELTLNYGQGDPCVTNLHFTSRTEGWFASRCGGADEQQSNWRGGSWTVAEATDPITPGESGLRFATTGRPGDQNYRLNQTISALTLPTASGGTGALTYSLTPVVPGLSFDPASRQLTGTPTEAGAHAVTYTATDEQGETDSFKFLIVVRDEDSEDCLLGLLVRPGESCNYPGTTNAFSVQEDGSASFLVITSTRAINLPNRTYLGQIYDFRASHQGDGVWRIDRLEGVEAPPPDTTPRIPEADAPGDQTYTLGAAITRLTLPAATHGEGTLTYSLTPNVPGLSFSSATRQLSGTPTLTGSYQMTYRVADEDGDTSSVSFTITVHAEETSPEEGEPDLIVVSPLVNGTTLATGQPFIFRASVRNQGDAESVGTKLRYYRSSDMTISTSDTELEDDILDGLSALQSRDESERLLSPLEPGTYYYGACVDSVANESDTTNNCSIGVRVTVTAPDTPIEGRELVVESPTASDTSLTIGQLFTLSVTVRNRGTETTPSTSVRFYLSTDSTISTSDTSRGTDNVASLPASATSFESIRIAAPSTPGDYYYGACVQTVANEANASNNCSAAVLVRVSAGTTGENTDRAIPSRMPDLAVDSARVSVSSGDAKFDFDLSVRVRNAGNASAQATTLTYYQSSDSRISPSDTSVGTDTVDRLAVSGSSNFSVNLSAPSDSGTYYYGGCVNSVVNEQNTNNNCSSGARIRVQFDGPDLQVDSASVSDSTPSPGEDFTLRARVRNTGNKAADAATLTYYESQDSMIDTGDTSVGTADDISALSASQSSSQNTPITAPTQIGVYYYGACVSVVSGDTNPNNNCSTKAARIKIPGADLVVQSPNVSDSTPEPGDRFALSVSVRNNGVEEASATTLTYYRSTDSTIDPGDVNEGTDSVASLAPGRSDDEATSVTAQDTPGTYYYGACVQTVSNEDDTENNCSTSVKVTVSAADLVVQSPRVDDASPDVGDRFTLSVTVGNSGGSTSPSTTLTYYKSTDDTISAGDDTPLSGTDRVGSLRATETNTESISVTAPDAPGVYYYGACVATFSNESDAANNCSTGVKVTVPAPDLVVDSASVDDATPQAGERFVLNVRVRNLGQGAAEATTVTYYQSTDDTIDTSDTPVGETDGVGKLDPSETDNESTSVTAPTTPGIYYFGACVAVHKHESDQENNCSSAIRVTVPAPDLVVDSPRVDDSSVQVEEAFELTVRVRNRGAGTSAPTKLNYYESSDSDIDPNQDFMVGNTDAVNSLDPSESTTESENITPKTAGSYYYGACVAAVDHESSTDNNCSSGVRVSVRDP